MGCKQSTHRAGYAKVVGIVEVEPERPPDYVEEEATYPAFDGEGMARIRRLFELSEKLDAGLCTKQLDRIADMIAPELGAKRNRSSTAKILREARRALQINGPFEIVEEEAGRYDAWTVVAARGGGARAL